MKVLSEDSLEAIEIIKRKVISKDFRLNKVEFLALKAVYEEISTVFVGKTKTIKEGCSSCIPTAMNIVSNYLKLYPTNVPNELKEPKEQTIAKIINVKVETTSTNNEPLIEQEPIKPKKKNSNAKRKRK